MRRLFTLMLAMSLAVLSWADEPKGAMIELSTNVVDLGKLSHDAPKQRFEVEYTNTGDLPLVLLEVRTSCTCTTTRYERRKLLPGQKATIAIEMEPRKAPEGSFYRVLQLLSTAKNSPANIVLKAEIVE